ncbi:MAG TPA: EVE domain-containing protein [Oculatellaceae cyanobacterium]
MNYWLFKSEPSVFSIDDLASAPKKTTFWDGVRNFQARNFLRDSIKLGDQVFFYHSNSEPSAIAGIAEVVKEGYPDFTAFDPEDPHYDPKSKKDSPTWYMVDIKFKEKFDRPLDLNELKTVSALKNMALLQKGSRLSIQPVTEAEWKSVVALSKKKAK